MGKDVLTAVVVPLALPTGSQASVYEASEIRDYYVLAAPYDFFPDFEKLANDRRVDEPSTWIEQADVERLVMMLREVVRAQEGDEV